MYSIQNSIIIFTCIFLTIIFTASAMTAGSIQLPSPNRTALDPILRLSFQPGNSERDRERKIERERERLREKK